MEGWNTTRLGMPNITPMESSEFKREIDHSKRDFFGHW
jgi:hypothetical protein